MQMTDEQKYSELLKELGEIIKYKNDEIVYLKFRNSDLEKMLKKAEEQLEDAVASGALLLMKSEKQG